jgi:hypothetical protein
VFGRGVRKYWRRHPWSWLKMQTLNLVSAVVLFCRLMRDVPDASLRREYRRRIWRLLKARPDLFMLYTIKCALHYHQYTLSRQMTQRGKLVNTF